MGPVLYECDELPKSFPFQGCPNRHYTTRRAPLQSLSGCNLLCKLK